MSEALSEIIKSAIAGDAAGYVFEGMKKGHIDSFFRNHSEFPDTTDALKGNMEKWKKPGLYSSISQFILIIFMFRERNHTDVEGFKRYIRNLPVLPERPDSFFRNPGRAEEILIATAGDYHILETDRTASSRLIPISLPLSTMKGSFSEFLDGFLSFMKLFSEDCRSLTASFLFCYITGKQLRNKQENGDFSSTIVNMLKNCIRDIADSQSVIFSHGFNPDYFLKEAEFLTGSLEKAFGERDIENSERSIVDDENKRSGSHLIRATVDNPSLIFLYAVLMNHYNKADQDIIYKTARLGGSSSALTSATAVISQAFFSVPVHKNFMDDLINKKMISQIADSVAAGKNSVTPLKTFTDTEVSLTLKEMEEYKSKNKRNKNVKKNKPARKNRTSIEETISRHVVESWTKTDKARWKREKRRKNTDSVDDEEGFFDE